MCIKRCYAAHNLHGMLYYSNAVTLKCAACALYPCTPQSQLSCIIAFGETPNTTPADSLSDKQLTAISDVDAIEMYVAGEEKNDINYAYWGFSRDLSLVYWMRQLPHLLTLPALLVRPL